MNMIEFRRLINQYIINNTNIDEEKDKKLEKLCKIIIDRKYERKKDRI